MKTFVIIYTHRHVSQTCAASFFYGTQNYYLNYVQIKSIFIDNLPLNHSSQISFTHYDAYIQTFEMLVNHSV